MASEFQLLNQTVSQLTVPFVALPGNHDYKHNDISRFNARFGTAPRVFDNAGVHFVLIDNADQHISEANFEFLDQDLAANQGKPIVVAMHVPVLWHNTPAGISMLHKLLPGTIAQPKIENANEVGRFTGMMARYHVSLVLAGHTHLGGDYTDSGIPYVVAGAVGGKLLNVGASHEYVDVTIDNGKVSYKHVALDDPTDDVVEVAKNMVEYYLMQIKEEKSGVGAS
jgi:3',5'-cyclic AMP phosphodiesterase CpdA